jgi:hypothetical protein
MKIHLYIRDLGGGQPVIQVNGTTGQMYPLVWDPKRCAHVRSWDVSTLEGMKVFRRESVEILNQRLMWPVLVDASEDNEECGMRNVELSAAQRAITELKAENSALKAKLLEVGKVERGEPEGEPAPAFSPMSRQQKAALTRMARKAAQ